MRTRPAALLLAAALVLLTPSIALPADRPDVPAPAVVGADAPARPGEVCTLTVPPPKDAPADLVATSYRWRFDDPDSPNKPFFDVGNGTVVFGTGMRPRDVKVRCVVTYLFAKRDASGRLVSADAASRDAEAVVSVRGDAPPAPGPVSPAPKPPPAPPPAPPGLDAAARSMAGEFLTSYGDALGRAADAMDAGAAPKDALGKAAAEWQAARAAAFDRRFKGTVTGVIPEDAAAPTPAQVKAYADVYRKVGRAAADAGRSLAP